MFDRRTVLGAGIALPVAAHAQTPAQTPTQTPTMPINLDDFAAAQRQLSAEWDIDRSIANFDSAYYGVMPRSVHQTYVQHTQWVNRHNSLFLRSALPGPSRDDRLNASRTAVAELIGASMEEVALCNGGTEALYALITNYRRLEPGDAVIIADIDYDEMQHAMTYLRESRGAEVVRLAIPEPSTDANVLAAYERVLHDTPRAKLLLLTHVSNRHGLIPPVREIVAIAKARGVDVILDSAQAIGQLPFTVADTGADFIGFSLHKWLAAPLGTGGIYIAKDRLADVAPYMGNRIRDEADVRARILTGTINYAAHLTIPSAIDFHRRIGAEAKLRHLQRLRDYWVTAVRDVPGVEIVQPEAPLNYGAISAFRLPTTRTWEGAQALQARFLTKHGLMIVARRGLEAGPAMRVTPGLFNTTDELDRLIAAIRDVVTA